MADCFASAWFDADENFVCDSGIFTLRTINYDSVQSYHWIIKKNGIAVLDTLLTSDTLVWNCKTIGTYDVTLQIKYGSLDSSDVTRTNFLQVADCGNTIASEQGNWYFGQFAGLKFTSGGAVRDINPSQTTPNIYTTEGSFSQSNTNGQLLFYGAGDILNPGDMVVYNKDYLAMPSNPIIGDFSSCQTASVIPHPSGDTNKYMLLTVSGEDAGNKMGFRYSIIDMSLNGGLGDIVAATKNTPIGAPSSFKFSSLDSALLVNEQITVIPKCTPNEYWVLVTNYSDTVPFKTLILVYTVNNSGISYYGQSDTLFNYYGVGQLKASPDGNWLYLWGKLLRFDKATGAISLYRTLINDKPNGASFSPNSTLLYSIYKSELFQFDLQCGNDSLCKTKVTDYPVGEIMQLGPDNRIYISKYNYGNLGVINSPDSNITLKQPNAPLYSFNGPEPSSNGIGGSCLGGYPICGMQNSLLKYPLILQ